MTVFELKARVDAINAKFDEKLAKSETMAQRRAVERERRIRLAEANHDFGH